MNQIEELPQGWVWATLGESCLLNPRFFVGHVDDDWLISFVQMAAVEARSGQIDVSQVRPYGEVRKGYTRFSEGDVLFAKITPCMENGKIAIAKGLTNGSGCGSTEFHVLRPVKDLSQGFLMYFLLQDEFRREAQRHMAGTAGQLRVPAAWLTEAPIPLPPFPEQHRIVVEIETQFTRLDASVAALRRAQANLKRYRASVLKAACEGRLVPTEAELAHSLRAATTKPAGVLLERILAERRARWESQEKRRGKYKEPSTPDASAQPELPEGWVWATIEQLLARSEYGTSVKCSYDAAGLPVLRIPNIVAGEIDLTDIKYATQPVPIESETSLTKGDVLMCRTNGSVRLVGKTAVVTSDLEPYHGFASYLLRFRLMETKFIPKWFHIYTTSQLGRAFIEKNAASSAGQNNVSLSLIHTMPMPLPPLAEQRRIVADVERRLSVVQQTEATVEASLARAERLRQSILKQAFSGKLVPQDPDDEPASALLERIKAEREAEAEANASVKNKSRRRSTRKATA